MYHLIKGTLSRPAAQAHSGPYASKEEAQRAADRAIPSGYDWAVIVRVDMMMGYPMVEYVGRVVRQAKEA